MDDEVYKRGLISATSDGASVNMGIYNGLLKKIRDDDWPRLVAIHLYLQFGPLFFFQFLFLNPQRRVV